MVIMQFLPLLGLPPSGKFRDRLSAAASLEKPWQELLAQGRLALTAAARLADWAPDDRAAAWPCLSVLPFSQSKQEEFLEWVEILARREGVTARDLLARPELTQYLAGEDLSPQEKATGVRRLLQRWGFPEWTAVREEFQKNLAQFFTDYGLFLAKTITLIAAILATVVAVIALAVRSREEGRELEIKKLNDKFRHMKHVLQHGMLPKAELKKYLSQEKKSEKELAKNTSLRRRIFVLNFEGDIRASAVNSLREEVSAIFTVATSADEVLIRVHSGGGMVHTYGLAASQLMRIKQHNIPLTVAVDKIAASGGYLMACVANKIIAAPFAIVGSIGVIAQIPNFNRLLKKSTK